MTDPDGTSKRRGARRRSDQPAPFVPLLATQLFAVVAVTAVITAVVVLTGGTRGSDDPPGTVAPASATTGEAMRNSPSAAATPSGSRPGDASTPAATPAATPSKTESPRQRSRQALRVDVLNQSGPSGAAAKVAARLRHGGWRIGRVDNFDGNVRRTTVYYPSGERKAARAVAKTFGHTARVLPRLSTMSRQHLTVVIARRG